MRIRKQTEDNEEKIYSKFATLSNNTKGRLEQIEPCEVRTEFQRDRDRIIHSKSFRRLKHKTQVFIAPEGDHYRTRLTHTLEVAQIARTIARGLRLNEDLTEAIAMGHDLGHTPFGHGGEEALNEVVSSSFSHNVHSLRVVDYIEELNLTYEVRDGILKHTGDKTPETMEGQVVRIADRIAYINHDIDDSLRAGIIREKDLPVKSVGILGKTHSQRIDTMVKDIIKSSWSKSEVKRSQEIKEATADLREYLFAEVYIGSIAKNEEDKAQWLLKRLFNYYLDHDDQIPDEFKSKKKGFDLEQVVIDYIAGMSDRFAINKGKELFIPRPWFIR